MIWALATVAGYIPDFFNATKSITPVNMSIDEGEPCSNSTYVGEDGVPHTISCWGKPVIYLYPQTPQNIKVLLNLDGTLTSSYPAYNNGWNIFAYPDGKLINSTDNKEYGYLFWEGVSSEGTKYDLSKGFVVEGKDTASFLQDKLSKMGLTPKEYNEFIVYWMPKMQNNKYNLIHFASKEEYDDKAKLTIEPKPDSMLRVFMVYKSLNEKVEVTPQEIKSFSRNGFSVVEWGGTEVE
jgi:hypothetical protein